MNFKPASNPTKQVAVHVGHLIAGVLGAIVPVEGQEASVVRTMPSEVARDRVLTVSLEVQPPAGAAGYAVQEVPPHAWRVENISHAGRLVGSGSEIGWRFADGNPRTLTFDLVPPYPELSVPIFGGRLMTPEGDTLLSGFSGPNTVTLLAATLAGRGDQIRVSGLPRPTC